MNIVTLIDKYMEWKNWVRVINLSLRNWIRLRAISLVLKNTKKNAKQVSSHDRASLICEVAGSMAVTSSNALAALGSQHHCYLLTRHAQSHACTLTCFAFIPTDFQTILAVYNWIRNCYTLLNCQQHNLVFISKSAALQSSAWMIRLLRSFLVNSIET